MTDRSQPPNGPEHRSGEPPPDPLAKLRKGGPVSTSLGSAGRYAGLGIQFAVSILVFLYAGQWLDRRLGTNGLFVIVGVFIGAGAAFYSMYRKLMADQRADEAREAASRAEKEQDRQ
jgi:F0F1-type ATP synthase assembly protein I